MNVGITGSRTGGTAAQLRTLASLMQELWPAEVHHGACVGVDEQAHRLALGLARPIHLHPPEDPRLMAPDCRGGAAVVYPPRPYLERDHALVDAVDLLIALPRQDDEVLRSGTWATIRYARKRRKEVVAISRHGQAVTLSPL